MVSVYMMIKPIKQKEKIEGVVEKDAIEWKVCRLGV